MAIPGWVFDAVNELLQAFAPLRERLNKLSNALLEALAADFEQYGEEAVKITRVERPAEYLKIVAGIMPKELEITDSRLKEIPDDELDGFIELLRQRRIAARDAEGREG